MNAITSHHNPVHTTTLHREDGSIEYLIRGPTEGSLAGPIERLKMSFQRSDITVSRPVMVSGEVRVSIMVHPR